MSVKSKKMREERAKLVPVIRKAADAAAERMKAGEGLTAEEEAEATRANDAYNRMTRAIELEEAAELWEASQDDPAGDPEVGRGRRRSGDAEGRRQRRSRREDREKPAQVSEEARCLAFQGWARYQMDVEPSRGQRAAMRQCGYRPGRRTLNFRLNNTEQVTRLQGAANCVHRTLIKRSLSGIDLPAGGGLVPESYIRNLEIAMLAYGGLRQAAEIMRTSTGEPMPWPTANDTGNTGRRLGQNEEYSADGSQTADPTFGLVYWHAHKYTSDAILVPYELLEDAAFNLVETLGRLIGERLGRITNRENTVGTGNGQPAGIVTRATLGVTAANAASILPDELIQLEHSVDPAYRLGAGYMGHDNTTLAIRLLKDGEGRYMWSDNLREGKPQSLNGHPFFTNQDMASSVATGNKVLLYGQLSNYKIREVGASRIYRLEELYRANDQDGFVGFLRQDGNLLDAGVAPVKYLQMA